MGMPRDPDGVEVFLVHLTYLEAAVLKEMCLADGGAKVYIRQVGKTNDAAVEILTHGRIKKRLMDVIRKFNARGGSQIVGIK